MATPVKEVKLALPAPIMCKVPQLREGLMRPLLLHNERVDGPALCGYCAGNQGCHCNQLESSAVSYPEDTVSPETSGFYIVSASTSELLEEVI